MRVNQHMFVEHSDKLMEKQWTLLLCAWIALYEPYTHIYRLSFAAITTTVFSIMAAIAPIQALRESFV